MSDDERNIRLEPKRDEIWRLGPGRHPLLGLVRRVDGDTVTVIPMHTDLTLQDEDSVIIADNWMEIPFVAWPHMPIRVDRYHFKHPIGWLTRTDSRLRMAAGHGEGNERTLKFLVACLILDEETRVIARKLEERHALAAGM